MKKGTIAKSTNKPVYIKIGTATLNRHDLLFHDGDYAAIAEMIDPPTQRGTVGKRIKAGTAPVALAQAIRDFYIQKERDQKGQNAVAPQKD